METEDIKTNDNITALEKPKAKKTASKNKGSEVVAGAEASKANSKATKANSEANNADAEDNEDDGLSLKDVIMQNATEDDAPLSKNITLSKILGGDILTTTTVRRQIWVFLLIAFFALIYISNRYSCQQDLIEIDKLQERLQDAKYKALSTSSQMTEKSRESNVLEMLRNNNDSTLKTPSQPPYIITVPEDN